MATKGKSDFWSVVALRAIILAAMIFGLLPYVVLYYVVAPLIYVVVYRVARYRVKVTRQNLANAFPEKSQAERRKIERRFYHHLSELFVDVVDMSSLTKWGLHRRMHIDGIEEFDRQTEGKSWIAALSHYGEWEYFVEYALTHPQSHSLGVYHPLENKAIDRFYLYNRSRFGIEPVPMRQLARTVLQYRDKGEPIAIGLIADQKPYWQRSDRVWHTFLNQPTLFFGGLGHYAKRFEMPVYFLHIEKRCRAHYRASFELIYDGHEPIAETEITARYAAALEKMIRQRPELWLWSHRRWVAKPQNADS